MTVKDNDRIRATLGDSVLVGTAKVLAGVVAGIVVDGEMGARSLTAVSNARQEIDHWTIEVLLPAEPSVGTIVRFRHHDSARDIDNGLWMRSNLTTDNPWLYLSADGRMKSGASWAWLCDNGTVNVEVRA